jgi:hypothetical protein
LARSKQKFCIKLAHSSLLYAHELCGCHEKSAEMTKNAIRKLLRSDIDRTAKLKMNIHTKFSSMRHRQSSSILKPCSDFNRQEWSFWSQKASLREYSKY